jgi:intein/homing endonuclease
MKILTPSGFQKFDGVAKWKHDDGIEIKFRCGTSVTCSKRHKFVYDTRGEVMAFECRVGDLIGGKVIEKISVTEGQYFYDPINVANGSVYYHDNFVPSTQTFFGTGDTLINAETLMSFRSKEPLRILEGGQMLIYSEPCARHEYIMTVDVSKGRGQDYSTFNLIDISTQPFKQVAVYRNNTISPILFPNIIYKYAKLYNNAYVVIENNDQGSLTCYGLYHEIEYENVHLTSATKSDAIGIYMDRKVKRIGCSSIKDILEERKLEVYDQETIIEISTFVAKGQSYEASDGNHDDLMMNLVMFGYFANTQFFADMTDINIKQMLFDQRIQDIADDLPPFGFIDNNEDLIDQYENEKQTDQWQLYDPFGERETDNSW